MLKQFWQNTSGNFSVMMAGGFLMLMGGIGLSVDYLGMTEAASELQAAVDGAALAAVLSGEEDEAKIKTLAEETFESFREQGLNINANFTFNENSIIVTAETVYQPQIMSLFGFGSRTISATAETPISGIGNLDITLVLDVTDSMEFDGKIDAMKLAVSNFIDEFDASGGDIRVSVVPFSQYVNVGTIYASQPWIDNSEEGSTFPPVTSITTTGGVCTGGLVSNTCTRERDGVEFETTCNSCPGGRTGGVTTTMTVEPLREWDGCVGSRLGNKATQPHYAGSPFPAVYDDGREGAYRHTDYACPDALMPLTDDLVAVRNMVNNLNTDGTTYMPSGLAWGWRTLDDDIPLGKPIAGQTRNKALILMTDGHNTVSHLGADKYHYGEANDSNNVTEDANTVTERICDNLASTDIIVYTIAYALPDGADADETVNLLSNCASSPENSFESGNIDLDETFKAIGRDLSQVRLIN